MNVSLADPQDEARCTQLGEKMFFYRGGTHDFACVTCHGEDGKRIRLQDLPNLTTKAGAQKAYTTWPAYRVSQGELRTMQWRLNDCFRQQRFPELVFGSAASIALTTFLAYNANGARVCGPGTQALSAPQRRIRNAIATGALLALAALVAAGCATMRSDAALHADTVAMLKASFKARGQAQLDRLDQDETQRVCSDYFGKPLPPDVVDPHRAVEPRAIQYPADGKSTSATGKPAKRSRRKAAASSSPTIRRDRSAATATPATS